MELGSILTPRRETVELGDDGLNSWTPITIHFDGSIVSRDLRGKQTFKGRLFAAYPGDLVFSKIDARNGAIGLLPTEIQQAVVTSEYPVYRVDGDQVDPNYLALLLRTTEFRRLVNALVSGTSGRKRVQPAEFVEIEIPLPELDTQHRLTKVYYQMVTQAETLEHAAARGEEAAKQQFEQALGLKPIDLSKKPKLFLMWWSETNRWSVRTNRLRKMGFQESPISLYSPVSIGDLGEVTYGLQVCPERRRGKNPVPYLRVANVQRGYLDLAEIKHLDVTSAEIERYRLRAGDVLLCEGNSADLVGRGAIWRGEIENCVHQNHVLRVRLNTERVLPDYVLAYINSSVGQAYFRSKAKRTTNLASINSREVAAMPVPLPPIEIQRSLMAQMQSARDKAHRLRSQAAELRESSRQKFETELTRRIPKDYKTQYVQSELPFSGTP